jgi:hypothetical protein
MRGVPAIAANPREGSRLLWFWVEVPNSNSEIGTTRLARARACGTQVRIPEKLLLDKLRDVELSLRGVLRGFGLKLGKVTQRAFETRVRELVANHPMLQQITGSMLLARATLQREHNMLHKALLKIVRRDKVCRQFMTAPGVGPIVAIAYKTAVDDPHRIKKSKGTGPLFGVGRAWPKQMALHVVVRRHERQVNPVNILPVKDLDDAVSMAVVRPDPKSVAALDAR